VRFFGADHEDVLPEEFQVSSHILIFAFVFFREIKF